MATINVKENAEEVLDPDTLASSRWIRQKELREMILEECESEDYQNMILCLQRLVELPFSYKIKEFIWKYRKDVAGKGGATSNIPKPKTTKEGRSFVKHLGQRKSANATVKVYKPGTGRISIRHVDHMDIESDSTYFFK